MRCSLLDPTGFAALIASLACAACSSTSEPAPLPVATTPPALERLEQERAAPSAFFPYLADAEASVRARAALALGRLEYRASAPPLLPLLDDADASVRATAAFSLGQTDLTLEPEVAAHQETRAQVERALAGALTKETDRQVRRAIVRALGRVAVAEGLHALIALASGADPLAADALTGLGVSGARRQATLARDPALLSSLAVSLRSHDVARTTAGAYAAFRQKAALDADLIGQAWTSDAQARVFLVRAGASQEPKVRADLATRGLKDPDWRVRVEALRISRVDEIDAVSAVLDDAVARLLDKNNAAPALAHVVREACASMLAMEAPPARVLPALSRATAALLPAREQHRAAACACATAKDALEADADDTRACAEGADDAAVGKLNVQLASQRKVSSKERVAVLAKLIDDDVVKVRMAAAGALAADGSAAAAEAAAVRLAQENDAAVMSALLELFATPETAPLLSDERLVQLVARVGSCTTFEQCEPLLALAKLARSRDSEAAKALVRTLMAHAHPSVRDAAAGVPSGDRAPGPRARVFEVPRAADVPMWAVLKTSRGDIRIAFDTTRAPVTVASFAALARAKLYDGTPFHRVIADFVSQGGDPRGDGSGGPGYSLACERSDETFQRGAIGMAHAGLDTGGSQFFLTHSSQPHLDGRYTLFAHVVEGLEVMDALQPDDTLLSVDFFSAAPRR